MSDVDKPRGMLMCMAVREGPPPAPSKKFFCVQCGECVWVSQPMVPKVMQGEFGVWCIPCAQKADDDGEVEWGLDPDQEPQLDAFGILDFARKTVEAMRERKGK